MMNKGLASGSTQKPPLSLASRFNEINSFSYTRITMFIYLHRTKPKLARYIPERQKRFTFSAYSLAYCSALLQISFLLAAFVFLAASAVCFFARAHSSSLFLFFSTDSGTTTFDSAIFPILADQTKRGSALRLRGTVYMPLTLETRVKQKLNGPHNPSFVFYRPNVIIGISCIVNLYS